jgi:hypothetical protein
VRVRLQPWLLAIGLVALCLSVLGGLYWYRARVQWTSVQMASYLPRVNTTVAFVDLDKLREAGLFDLIAGSKSLEELDYRQFVDASGFDYRTDLEAIAIAFQGDNRFVVARGKFDWRRINDYLVHSGGTCHNSVCNYQHNESLVRSVAYFPIRPAVMGLYSGPTDWGIYEVTPRRIDDPIASFPDAPVWISVPASAWTSAKDLPAGTKAFASVFAEAERVVFSINADASKNLKLYADVTCGNPELASKVNGRLSEATGLLRKMMAREHQTPNARDLSGLLSGGEFKTEANHVKATWPLDRAFIEALASGSIN